MLDEFMLSTRSWELTNHLEVPPTSIVWQVERLVPGLLPTFVELVNRVQGVSEFTSWWRGTSSNARVGGLPDSQHLWAAAVDVTGDLDRIQRTAIAQGLVAVRFPRHVHIQAWPAGTARRIGLVQALAF